MAVNVAQVNEEAESRLTRSLNLERLHATTFFESVAKIKIKRASHPQTFVLQ